MEVTQFEAFRFICKEAAVFFDRQRRKQFNDNF